MRPTVVATIDARPDPMSLSDDDRRALERLEEELATDPEIDAALKSLGGTPSWKWPVAAILGVCAALVVTVILLSISAFASFGFFVAMFALAYFAARRHQSTWTIESIRTILNRSERS